MLVIYLQIGKRKTKVFQNSFHSFNLNFNLVIKKEQEFPGAF